jgi:hypothetical protein
MAGWQADSINQIADISAEPQIASNCVKSSISNILILLKHMKKYIVLGVIIV